MIAVASEFATVAVFDSAVVSASGSEAVSTCPFPFLPSSPYPCLRVFPFPLHPAAFAFVAEFASAPRGRREAAADCAVLEHCE